MSRFTARTTTGLRNVHEREVSAAVVDIWRLVTTLGTDADLLWPADRWPRMRLTNGIEPGSDGGHGPIRYHVETVEPERSVRFVFEPATGFHGWHEFRVSPAASGSRLTHLLEVKRPRTAVRLMIVPLHDALIEDLLDQMAAVVADRPVVRSPLRPLVRARRALIAARSRR